MSRYRPNSRKRTHCLKGHKLTPSNVYLQPDGRRYCKKCHLHRTAIGDGIKERKVYMDAKSRCCNPKLRCYPNYGGRGIEFRFKSYKEFIAHIGPRPKGYVLDRIDNNGHYEIGNVRWVTWSESNTNKRNWTEVMRSLIQTDEDEIRWLNIACELEAEGIDDPF